MTAIATESGEMLVKSLPKPEAKRFAQALANARMAPVVVRGLAGLWTVAGREPYEAEVLVDPS